jgi:hypothetical protein
MGSNVKCSHRGGEHMETMVENLRYRRQFILTNEVIDELGNWQHLLIKNWHLYVHPDLEITSNERTSRRIVLLGYMFDPFNPEKGNEAILQDIVSMVSCFDDLISAIKVMAGSYVIFYEDQESVMLIHDPLGIREIYYCTGKNRVICGSQPNLLNKYSMPELGLTMDKAIHKFVYHDMPLVRTGRLWVGDETFFRDIKHLLPNHCLDVNALTPRRYWPNKRLGDLNAKIAVKLACEYLRGVMKGVTLRYKVMMAVTAGYDSRSLLAGAREVLDQVYLFINRESYLNDESADIWVPRKMLDQVKIPFHVHSVEGEVDKDFREIFKSNVFGATDRTLPTIYNVYYKKHQDKVNILGVGEIGREYYGKRPRRLDGYYLARCLKFRNSVYASEQCEKWLQEADGPAKEYNVDIMKLLLWEMLLGKWGANANSESDIAIEEFDPYDSHYIYEILIAGSQGKRELFREMINEMWPELLEFPINPPESIADWVKYQLGRLGAFQDLRRFVYFIDRFRFKAVFGLRKGSRLDESSRKKEL